MLLRQRTNSHVHGCAGQVGQHQEQQERRRAAKPGAQADHPVRGQREQGRRQDPHGHEVERHRRGEVGCCAVGAARAFPVELARHWSAQQLQKTCNSDTTVDVDVIPNINRIECREQTSVEIKLHLVSESYGEHLY